MKQGYSRMMAALLTAAMLLSGCANGKAAGGETPTPKPDSTEAPAPTQTPAPTLPEGAAAPERGAQIACIADHSDLWLHSEAEDAAYCMMDLDGNGLIEVVGTRMDSEGLASDCWFYEVNAAADGLIELTYIPEEGQSAPDLLYPYVKCFPVDGVNHFIFSDVQSLGNNAFAVYDYALSKQGAELRQELICWATQDPELPDSDEGRPWSYFDRNGQPISAADYETLYYDPFGTGEAYVAYYPYWSRLTAEDDLPVFAMNSIAEFLGETIGTDEFEDYQVDVYFDSDSAAYHELDGDVQTLEGAEGADTAIRFVSHTDGVQVSLLRGEWVDTMQIFNPTEEVFSVLADAGVVYEFPAVLAEAVPAYQLKVRRLGKETVWNLLAFGYGPEDGLPGMVSLRYEEPELVLPSLDDPLSFPILAACQVYAGLIVQEQGDTAAIAQNDFWRAAANAAALQATRLDPTGADRALTVPDWQVEAYAYAMFAFTAQYIPELQPEDPVTQQGDQFVIEHAMAFDDSNTRILSVEEDLYGSIVLDISVTMPDYEHGVRIVLFPDDSHPLGYVISSAVEAKG